MKATPALDARKGRILAAIIQEYIHSAEPVASEVVVRRSGVEVSSATVRHEMAVLEEMGFLSQPHTSAGRIPTDRAYRFYVDALLNEARLSAEERQRLRRQIHSLAEEAERVIQGAARGAGGGGACPLGDRHGPPAGAPLPPPALRAAGCAPRAGRDCHRCRSLRRPAGRTARVG